MCVGSSNWARLKSSSLPVRGAVCMCSEPSSVLPLCASQATAKSIANKEIKFTAMQSLRISGFLCVHPPHSLALPESEVQRGQDEQVKQRRGHKPAQNHDRHGVLDLMTSHAASYRKRHQRQPRSPCSHQDRRQPLLGPPKHETWPERLALFVLEVLEVADHKDPVSSRDAEHGQKPDQRAQREDTPPHPHREHSPNQRHRKGEEEQQSKTQTPEGSLQEEQDHQRYGDPVDQQTLLGSGKLGGFSYHLHVVLPRQIHSRDVLLHGAHGGAKISSLHVGADVDPARLLGALYGVGGGGEANVGHLLQRNLLTPWRVDRKLAYAGRVVASLGRAPDVDVICLAALEDVPDLLAGDQCGRLAAHISWLDAVVARSGQVHLDLQLWYFLLEVRVRVDETGYVLHLL